MKQTDKLKLSLPAGTEPYDIEVFNENFRKIDTSTSTMPIKTSAESIEAFVKSEDAKAMDSGATVIISGQIYMFLGGNVADVNSYVSYGGNTSGDLTVHTTNNVVHVTTAERTKWNTVDSALSTTSVNPIQNKVVQTALSTQNTALTNKIDALTVSVNAGFKAANILKTKEEVTAVTVAGKVADALVTKEIIQSLNNGNMDFTVGTDGYPYATYKVGADSVSKKLGKSALSGSLETSVSSTGQSVYPSGSAQINLSVVDYNTLKISNCSLNSTAGHTNSFSVSSNLGTITTSFGNGIYNIKSCNYVSIYMYHQKTNSDGGKIMACNWEIS